VTRPELWLLIGAMAVITFGLRASFLLAANRLTLPTLAGRALAYVPPAVLAAIVAPALTGAPEGVPGSVAARPIAAAIAALVAWRTRSVLATFAVGMAALWGASWLLG
jgi:branched-subunit amino acid transport protein